MPGFRPGRVPRPVLEARLGGADALRQQALSDALPDLYARAVVDTELDPIAAPEIDITSGEDGGPVTFDAVVEIRPSVAIPGYQGLVVTLPGLRRHRRGGRPPGRPAPRAVGRAEAVGRAAADGDYVTIDLHGARPDADDLDVDDYLHEVGAGSDVEGLDDQLRGRKAGDILQFDATLPAGPAGRPSQPPSVSWSRRSRRRTCRLATDEWAAEASEFDTIDELRDDLRARIGQVKLVQAQLALRDRAIEALVGPGRGRAARGPRRRRGARAAARPRPPARGAPHDASSSSSPPRDAARPSCSRRSGARRRMPCASISPCGRWPTPRARGHRRGARRRARRHGRAGGHDGGGLQQSPSTAAGRLPAVRSDRRKAKALAWLLDNVDLVDDDGAPIDRDDAPGLEPGRRGAET